MLRRDRDPTAEARSPPDQMACFSAAVLPLSIYLSPPKLARNNFISVRRNNMRTVPRSLFAFSQPVQSGLLIVGTLCYCLGGLLCLWGAWRRRRVATEVKQMEANTPSPPNAAAQKVASTIESIAVYSAWHAANHRSFMFDDAARDLEARRRAGERLQALLHLHHPPSTPHTPHTLHPTSPTLSPSHTISLLQALLPTELSETIAAVAWHSSWYAANTRRWLYLYVARDKRDFEESKRRLRRQLGLKPSLPRASSERRKDLAEEDLAEAICQLCWAGAWHASNTRSMRWISAAGDAFRFGEASCRLLVLLQHDRAFNSLRLLEQGRAGPETSATTIAAAAASRHNDGGGGGDGGSGGSGGSSGGGVRPLSPLTPRSDYALGLAFGSRAVAKLIVARDADGITPPASPAAAPRLRLRRLSGSGGSGSGGGDYSWLLDGSGGDSGGGGGGVPLFSAEPTLGRELSVLRRCTSALDDVTLKWRAVCVGPGGALPSELFVEAAYATISVFDSLGSAVGGCKKDMKRNADTLHASLHKQRQPGTYAASTLQQMVRAEVAELGVASAATGKSGSSDAATLALLWLARFLRVLEKLLAATSADSAAPLGPCISAAYASALQPHHTWVTQSVIVRALKFSSTREEFYGKLGADKAAAEQGVRDLLAVYSPPLAALQAFMLAEGLEKSDA